MFITETIQTSKNKVEIFIDGKYYFWLTDKEVNKLKIEKNMEISNERINNIIESIVVRRAKSKALSILKKQDRTQEEVRNKLKKDGYTSDVIDKAIEYLVELDYINDYRYVENYIESKKNKKSIIQIKNILKQKGINNQVIEVIIDDNYINEYKVLERLIEKKLINMNIEKLDKEQYQKLYYHFVRKGFNTTDVIKQLYKYRKDE